MVMVNITQLNAGKRQPAMREIALKASRGESDILLLQEPQTCKRNGIFNIPGGISSYSRNNNANKAARTAVWIKNSLVNSLKPFELTQHTSRDLATVLIEIPTGNKTQKIVIASLYCPSNDTTNKFISDPINEDLINLVNYCAKEKLGLVVGADANAHSFLWGENHTDTRGGNFENFLFNSQLNILNNGNAATHTHSKGSSSIIDISFANNLAFIK